MVEVNGGHIEDNSVNGGGVQEIQSIVRHA
jgi:hypothetical protein